MPAVVSIDVPSGKDDSARSATKRRAPGRLIFTVPDTGAATVVLPNSGVTNPGQHVTGVAPRLPTPSPTHGSPATPADDARPRPRRARVLTTRRDPGHRVESDRRWGCAGIPTRDRPRAEQRARVPLAPRADRRDRAGDVRRRDGPRSEAVAPACDSTPATITQV